MVDMGELGCSKCRFSKRGCKRCREPAFQAKQRSKEQAPAFSKPASTRRKRARLVDAAEPHHKQQRMSATDIPASSGSDIKAATSTSCSKSRSTHGKLQEEAGTRNSSHEEAHPPGTGSATSHQHTAGIPPGMPDAPSTAAQEHQTTSPERAPPPEAQTSSPTQCHDSKSPDGQAGDHKTQQAVAMCNLAASLKPDLSLLDIDTVAEAHAVCPGAQGKDTAAQQSPVSQNAALEPQQASQSRATSTEPQTALPSRQQAASSQGTASEERPSFLSMLQSKMDQQRQKRRASQSQTGSQSNGSLSDASLSSVHCASPSQPSSGTAAGSIGQGSLSPGTGTQAPEALAAPRHKVAMQKRRSQKRATAKKASKTRAFAQPGTDPRKALWTPPVSPYGLIEEYLYDDPWKLLVACMLLNVTAGKQVRKVLWRLFDIWPNAAVAAEALPDTLGVVENLIQPLGLFRKRTMAIKRFSQEYLATQWVDPIELHGIGQYASDAYFMFCRGLWQEVSPSDKDLLKYQEWLHSTNGEGTGLERDELQLPALPSP